MKQLVKGMVCFAAVLIVMTAAFCIPVFARQAGEDATAAGPVPDCQRTVYPVDSNGVTLQVVLDGQRTPDTPSGFRILSVARVSIWDQGVYAAVGSRVNIRSICISGQETGQSVSLEISYQARSDQEAALSWRNSSAHFRIGVARSGRRVGRSTVQSIQPR